MLNKLEVKNLQKKYDEKIVLKNISFNIENPGVYLIAGPNGSGKTTLLEILLYACFANYFYGCVWRGIWK